jgi:hypothetical protein
MKGRRLPRGSATSGNRINRLPRSLPLDIREDARNLPPDTREEGSLAKPTSYYRLTSSGRRALGQELASWNRFVSAVGLVLAAEG